MSAAAYIGRGGSRRARAEGAGRDGRRSRLGTGAVRGECRPASRDRHHQSWLVRFEHPFGPAYLRLVQNCERRPKREAPGLPASAGGPEAEHLRLVVAGCVSKDGVYGLNDGG